MKNIKISDELKDVFKELIVIYQYAIDKDTDGMSEYDYFLFLYGENLESGICYAAKENCDVSIYLEMEMIGKKLGYELSWFELPQTYYPIKKNKKLLKKRLKIMIKLLKWN